MASRDFSKLSDQELSRYSDNELAKIAGVSLDQVRTDASEIGKMSKTEAALMGAGRAISFGTFPVIKGIGAALGSAYGALESNRGGLSEKFSRILKESPEAFRQGRGEAIAEQQRAQTDRPGAFALGEIAGSVLTAPLTPIRSLKGAIGLGTAMGAGQAIGESDSIEEAGSKIVGGATSGGIGYGAIKGLIKGIPLAKTMASKAIDTLDEAGKKAFTRVSSALTGESERNIKTFIEKNDQINKLIAESGGDIGVAADTVREEFTKSIHAFRKQMGDKIGKALNDISPNRDIPIGSIVDALNRAKLRINVKLRPEDALEIDDIVSRLIDVGGKQRQVSLRELHEITGYLQERAKSAYLKGGQIFVPGKISQQAAKQGAREAKIILDKAVPELKEANNQLSQLHKIEENINRNIIAPGKSEAALLAAGGATSGRGRIYLQKLGEIVGKDFVGEAEKLSSAAAFMNPQLIPKDTTGKSFTRLAIGSALGGAVGGGIGSAAGAIATSPAALKQIINIGVISRKLLAKAMGSPIDLTAKGLDRISQFLESPVGKSFLTQNVSRNGGDAISRRLDQLK